MEEENKQEEVVVETETEQTQEVTYTQSEVDSRISKAVESALEKREAKLQKELETRIEKERNEAAEYAKLTEKEKQEADLKKRLEALEQREKELNNQQLLNQIQSDLRENNLPLSFAESLLTIQDNEKIKESIATIKQEFDNAINEQVKSALRQETPGVGNQAIEKDPFKSILDKYK